MYQNDTNFKTILPQLFKNTVCKTNKTMKEHDKKYININQKNAHKYMEF